MALEIEGTLIKKFETEKVSDKFQKREFVIETEEAYPQPIKFELTQDKCGLLDSYNEGDKMKVHFNLRGREWNGKYFVNVNAWRLESAGASVPTNSGGTKPTGGNFPPPTEEPKDTPFNDDLPF